MAYLRKIVITIPITLFVLLMSILISVPLILLVLFIIGHVYNVDTIRYVNNICTLTNITIYNEHCKNGNSIYDHDYVFYILTLNNDVFSSINNDMVYSSVNDNCGAKKGLPYDPGLLTCFRDEYNFNVSLGAKIGCDIYA